MTFTICAISRYILTGFALTMAILLTGGVTLGFADGEGDNLPGAVRQIPPPGIPVSPEIKAALEAKLSVLEKSLATLAELAAKKPELHRLLPDVGICHKAVSDALRYDEIFQEKELAFADQLLDLGLARAHSLERGEAPWLHESGPVIRAYQSKIDDSWQPYGVEIPPTPKTYEDGRIRLDLWCHGRGETLSELAFLQQRFSGKGGKIAPEGAIVLHLYGRYCNANKFAGEVDLFEALAHAKADYRIDEDRILIRGFSMGGAAAWQFAVHHADQWAAAAPGAGFSETPEFLKTFQGETLTPSWWEQKLWRWYDATNWAPNLAMVPTIAYSGEIDRQKQAADAMVAAAAQVGLEFPHLIGPQTAHAYHPETLADMETRLAALAATGRERMPRKVRFVTYTLRYDTMAWVRIDQMTRHWEQARIEAELTNAGTLEVKTEGVEAFTIRFEADNLPFKNGVLPEIELDGAKLTGQEVSTAIAWEQSFRRQRNSAGDSIWTAPAAPEKTTHPVKKHGLQGPIDDAFMDRFVHVSPGGKPRYDKVGEWVFAERTRAAKEWRSQFRGQALTAKDRDVDPEMLSTANLVLWGDPSSNHLIHRILPQLPIQWTDEFITVGSRTFDARHHALIMIYPNPLAPDHYVVLNSGFTFREYDYLNNARQTPKLPDWAVVDLREAPTSRFPGKIAAAGFFGEHWELVENRE